MTGEGIGKGEWRRTCKAHRRDGDPCGFWPIAGLDVCKMHGGRSPRAIEKTARFRAEQKAAKEMSRIGAPVAVNPTDALLDLIYSSAGHCGFYRQQVEEVAGEDVDKLVWGQVAFTDKTGGEDWGTTYVEKAEINAWLKLYNEERDRLADYCSRAIKLGIEERRVRLAESQGHQVAEAIRGVLGDLLKRLQIEYEFDAELQSQWKSWASEIVPARLRAIAPE